MHDETNGTAQEATRRDKRAGGTAGSGRTKRHATRCLLVVALLAAIGSLLVGCATPPTACEGRSAYPHVGTGNHPGQVIGKANVECSMKVQELWVNVVVQRRNSNGTWTDMSHMVRGSHTTNVRTWTATAAIETCVSRTYRTKVQIKIKVNGQVSDWSTWNVNPQNGIYVTCP
jgi:hypothetical protein